MKNKLQLYKEASALAESLLGEESQKKVKEAIMSKFNALGLDDADYGTFEQFAYDLLGRFSSYQGQLTETEKLAQKKSVPAA